VCLHRSHVVPVSRNYSVCSSQRLDSMALPQIWRAIQCECLSLLCSRNTRQLASRCENYIQASVHHRGRQLDVFDLELCANSVWICISLRGYRETPYSNLHCKLDWWLLVREHQPGPLQAAYDDATRCSRPQSRTT
jgi:hypothetical protein